jgi:hypothetical protein
LGFGGLMTFFSIQILSFFSSTNLLCLFHFPFNK